MSKLDLIKSKIYSRQDPEFQRQLAIWRFKGKKIVFTNGCFDILHLGHIDYLAKASELGNLLIVGLNTDESVRKLKGGNRPIQDEASRAMILASLGFVDCVVFFGEQNPYELIKTVVPDVLVKGADYLPEDIVGYDIVDAHGGEIVTISFLEGYSTSAIEGKILAGGK
ncbi:MAG: D-glycero-beta-D-manno-heptose 1-phosphate adenylyltransferase [Bacteroidetes bacterium]|nr:D-glycero-beta-D-manno-heptose 1-phosphate adenylyltransferase [Bacteroidota bacterium]